MDGTQIITHAVMMYQNAFESYYHIFLQWGQWLFYSSTVIAIVWLCLWKAFDSNSFQEAMPSFLREFFVIAFFFTIMVNALPWLLSVLNTATAMGAQLVQGHVDPSGVISDGVYLGSLIIKPTENAGLLSAIAGVLISIIAYCIVLFAFISIALDLAVTLIITYFFISASAFLMAFAVFPFTRPIARNTLDIVLANSIKLLGLYAVIAAGQKVFDEISKTIPTDQIGSLDIYGWIVAAAMLFWLVAKNLPSQLLKIVSTLAQDNQGTSAAATAVSTVKTAGTAVRVAGAVAAPVAGAAAGLAKIAGSTLANTTAHFNQSKASGSGNTLSRLGSAVKASSSDLGGAIASSMKDRAQDLKTRASGGQRTENVPGVAQRLYESTQNIKNNQPSSSGRKSAGSKNTRSEPPSS